MIVAGFVKVAKGTRRKIAQLRYRQYVQPRPLGEPDEIQRRSFHMTPVPYRGMARRSCRNLAGRAQVDLTLSPDRNPGLRPLNRRAAMIKAARDLPIRFACRRCPMCRPWREGGATRASKLTGLGAGNLSRRPKTDPAIGPSGLKSRDQPGSSRRNRQRNVIAKMGATPIAMTPTEFPPLFCRLKSSAGAGSWNWPASRRSKRVPPRFIFNQGKCNVLYKTTNPPAATACCHFRRRHRGCCRPTASRRRPPWARTARSS